MKPMKTISVPFFLFGKHTEADILRILKQRRQRQWIELEKKNGGSKGRIQQGEERGLCSYACH